MRRHYPTKVVLSMQLMNGLLNKYFYGTMPSADYELRRKFLYNKYNYDQLSYYIEHTKELRLPWWFVPEYPPDREI